MPDTLCSRAFLTMACVLLVGIRGATAQDSYDPSWYNPEAPYLKISVMEDGVYRVSRTALENAGLPASADPATFRLIENGTEIPLEYRSDEDALIFVGQRNRGTDEHWAYNYNEDWQSSTYHSLYSDTTVYWLTWGGTDGLRYETGSDSDGVLTTTVRDTLHLEQENTYFYGENSGNPLYTPGEGYYWRNLRLNATGATARETITVPLERLDRTTSDSLGLSVRLWGSSGSCHRATLEANVTDGATTAFQEIDEVEWNRYTKATLSGAIAPSQVPSSGDLTLRVTTYADGSCGTPNFVLLDWADVTYPRRLEADPLGTQHFSVPDGSYTFELTGYGTRPIVYHPASATRYTPDEDGASTYTFSADLSTTSTFWAVNSDGLRTPTSIQLDVSSEWARPSNAADYVILTTETLRSTAQQLAQYREAQSGYAVAVATIEDIYDQFDYGRTTPIAIRRFVRATQEWATPPRFLAIWADAPYPVYTENNFGQRRPSWAVPSFGYGPSDAWFAMQNGDLDDWSESLAIGRIPIRTNAQGETYLNKLQTYENASLGDWQKRMLMLAGGTSTSEQQSLQFYSEQWAMRATGVPGDSLYPAGMDTLYYFKRSDDILDTSFQDSLAVDLRRGAGWLNYFGHSAAQTWEIVTAPPEDFDNAGRLPFVVSLACKTGSFAGGRFEDKDEPSLGESLVVGSPNGGIAHWGTSELGNLLPSARLNDALINRVFRDTMRVAGRAIQEAKAAINAEFGQSSLYARHLLQYGLLGDPALKLNLPTEPDFHLAPELVRTAPLTPTPGETLTLSATLRNRGLVPADSVMLEVTFERPDGEQITQTRRISRFPLERTLDFSYLLDEGTLGTNRFRVRADPANIYAEANETNNETEKMAVVSSTGLAIVSPADQGIVPSTIPTLRWYVARQSDQALPVTVELDSVSSFDSGARQRAELTTSGISIDWTPPTALTDGQTYFWRARIADGEANPSWQSGTFTVRSDLESPGWLQQNPVLADASELTRLQYAEGNLAFDTFDLEILASSERGGGTFKGQFNIGGSRTFERLGRGFGVLVVDDTTGQVTNHASFCTYEVPNTLLDDGRCSQNVDGDAAIANLQSLLASLDEGDYVFTRTRHLGRTSGPTIPDQVKDLFCSLGTPGIQCEDAPSTTYSDSIATLTYDDLWLMQARKGYPEETIERVVRGDEETNEITRRTRLPFFHASGQILSPRIGPALDWSAFDWSVQLPSSTSSIRFDVLTADASSVLKTIRIDSSDKTEPLADIEAATHPFLRLRATLVDSTSREAPQLDQWRMTYTPPAELTSPPTALQSIPDTLKEGKPLPIHLPVINLGATTSNPVYVRYQITDASNQTRTAAVDTLEAIAPDEQRSSTVSLSTVGLSGENVLSVTIEQTGTSEPIPFNNTAVRNFAVRPDRDPPTLNVFADGKELRRNLEPVTNLQDPSLPFVSTQPTIEILLTDDNEYFPLSDTTLADVRLDERLIPFSSPDLTFEPASEAGEDARIVFTPDFTGQDTTHTLRVEAKDATGNELGEPYQTHFRVSTEQVIRNLYPYPNPMNTHTTFAFRVEGGTASPRDFQLRIYTLSGRLIRTFDDLDVNGGAGLRIGWNTLRWNGRDQDGDRVATGIYLYRVSMRGEEGDFEGDVEKIAVIR